MGITVPSKSNSNTLFLFMGIIVDHVGINLTVLHAGETGVRIEVIANSDVNIGPVQAVAFDPSTGTNVSSYTVLTKTSGSMNSGTFNGGVDILPTVSDGTYPIVVEVRDSRSDDKDRTTYQVNADHVVNLERGTPPGTNTEGKCCCDVSINISAAPVNIYVCDSASSKGILNQISA